MQVEEAERVPLFPLPYSPAMNFSDSRGRRPEGMAARTGAASDLKGKNMASCLSPHDRENMDPNLERSSCLPFPESSPLQVSRSTIFFPRASSPIKFAGVMQADLDQETQVDGREPFMFGAESSKIHAMHGQITRLLMWKEGVKSSLAFIGTSCAFGFITFFEISVIQVLCLATLVVISLSNFFRSFHEMLPSPLQDILASCHQWLSHPSLLTTFRTLFASFGCVSDVSWRIQRLTVGRGCKRPSLLFVQFLKEQASLSRSF